MGNPKKDGVDSYTGYEKHGIRHHGRGVREAERRLIREEISGTSDTPRHKKSKKGTKYWYLQYKVKGDKRWFKYPYRNYRNIQGCRQAAISISRGGITVRGVWPYVLKVYPESFRAVHKRRKEVVYIDLKGDKNGG